MKGTQLCSIQYAAEKIVGAASAAYWLEGHGATAAAYEHQKKTILEEFARLKILIEEGGEE